MEEEVSGLHDDVAPGAANKSSGEFGETTEDEAAGDSTARPRTQHWETDRRRTNTVAERLDELLPAGRGERNLRGVGRLDTTEVEVRDLATMEAKLRAGEGFDEARTGKGSGAEVSDEWTRPLVECGGVAHERSLSEVVL